MKTVPVTDLKKVNASQYLEGDVFISDKEMGVLYKGKIEPLLMKKDLKEYVKKKDVQKMITDMMKKEDN